MTENDIQRLLKLTREKKRYHDDNPEVGANFFLEENCIDEAAADLNITVSDEVADLIKNQLIYDYQHPRLMQPPAGFNRK